ncbi:MAG: ATP-grasp domain-containing protein [Syntrophomonadaceae bacterium]|nr:ATP-grasp domain-containing protein [Syntrophomonadaceae bacterium]
MITKKLVIIGANEFQSRLVEKAKNMGYETHVFAWEEGAACRNLADKFYPISITEKESILKVAKEINPMGVVSVGSDLAVPTVNYIAYELGLVGNSLTSSLISTNKYEMRKALISNRVPCPKFSLANNDFNPRNFNMQYPLIVKPVDRSGSRGVTKVEDEKALALAIKYARELSFKHQVLVEEFFQGQEYSMEMVSFEGQHQFLAITEKFTTGAPHFVETMHLQPGRIKATILDEAIEIVKQSLDALQIKYGASHAEFKVNKNEDMVIIEIGARMGGDYIGSDLVQLSTGYDFTRMVINVAVGKEPGFNAHKQISKAAMIKFIFSPDDVIIFDGLQTIHSDKLHKYVQMHGFCDQAIKDSSQRLGYFIIQCDTREECLELMGLKQ